MSPAHHPKAAAFVRQSLFAAVTNFAEFEARIMALPDEQSRGDAFEVFAEAYLATQRKHDAAQVWPLASVPTKTLQTLGLATQDYGVDGVFQTLLGHFNAYQVKFRSQRPALTWRELSTFMGLADSPHIRSRVLLTNCDDLPAVLNERQGFFCIRGSDLDRLEADDFRALEAWLANAAFVAPKKQPLPHQIEGLDALLPALETHDRVSAIMACGSGKTLLALWIAERRQAARILVLVPSPALLRQILHEWLRETSLLSLAYLCVCSDPTVKEGLDSLSTAQSDLDFQVSTDAASVRGFLDAHFTGTKIIFSTYQSAQIVGTALKKVFTFARDVKSAQSYVNDGAEGVATHLAGVADVSRLHATSPSDTKVGNESQSLVTSAATKLPGIPHGSCIPRGSRSILTAKDGEDANGSPETAGIFLTASLARRKFEAMKTSGLTNALQAEQKKLGNLDMRFENGNETLK